MLIAQRPDHLHQGGKWEFPGGKIEQQEMPEDALSRELSEELDIDVISCHPLMNIRHDYPDKSITLDVWAVTDFSGIPKGNEGQIIKWVAMEDLDGYAFPDANHAIISLLKEQYLLSLVNLM